MAVKFDGKVEPSAGKPGPTTMLTLEKADGCADEVHDNLNRTITFTRDDLTDHRAGILIHSVQASTGGAQCEDGAHHLLVELRRTTGCRSTAPTTHTNTPRATGRTG